MKIGVPKETAEGELRVALIPDVAASLVGKGLDVVVESGAGEAADVVELLPRQPVDHPFGHAGRNRG